MIRIYALAVALVVLIAPALVNPAGAGAAPGTWTGTRQQAIQAVIQRALAQRGVPYSYGGGNTEGPSEGSGSGSDSRPAAPVDLSAAPATTPLIPGLPIFGQPAPVAVPVAPTPKPRVVGFDSSGLIQYAFAGVGIKMPRSSGEQYKVGRKVLPSQALPGDLIFWGPEGSQSVALFIGNAQMVESTPPAVTVSPVRTTDMTPYLVRMIDQ